MRRRTVVWIAVLAALAVLVVLVVRWLDDGPRARLEAILSDAVGREVTIGGLDVDVTGSAVTLHRVTVANPEGLPGPPFLRAAEVRFEISLGELLARRIVGRVQAREVDARIVRFAEGTNLEGLLPTRAQRPPDRPPPELHLDYDVSGGRLVLEDLEHGQVLALGGVGIEGVVSNRDRVPLARAQVGIASVDLADVRLRDVELVAHASETGARLPSLRARVGRDGRMSGSGHLDLRGGHAWSFELGAQDVALDEDILPVAQRFLPLLATTGTGEGTSIEGLVDADVQLAGRGLEWETIAPTLEGSGRLTLRELAIPADAVLVSLAALVGRDPRPWNLGEASATFAMQDGWIELSRLEVDDEALAIPISGRVSFEGALDLRVDVLPLVRVFGGGAYAEVARFATSIPVRIGGTLHEPRLKPPTPRDLTGSLGGALLRRSMQRSTRDEDGL